MKNKRKIVILTYYRFPCSEPVLENVFAKELGREHEVTWLFQGDISTGKKYKWHNSQVLLTRAVKGNSYCSKLINKVLGLQRVLQLLRLLRLRDTKIVLVRDMPFVSLVVAVLRPIFRFRLYFQYSAPLGDMFISSSKSQKFLGRLCYLFLGYFHNLMAPKAIRTADIVFPITEFHKRQLFSHKAPETLVPITMGIDEEWVERQSTEIQLLAELKKTHFLIVYFGATGVGRNPRFILEVFAEIRATMANCKLLIITTTMDWWKKQRMGQVCLDLGIGQNTLVKGRLSKDELQDHLSYCDVSLSPIPPTTYFKISSPTKVYESLGHSVPVVANRGVYEQEKVIRESGGGILVDYEVLSFAHAIVDLLKNVDLRVEMARRGREYVLNRYSYRLIADNIAKYFA